jgi:hypothetical protein
MGRWGYFFGKHRAAVLTRDVCGGGRSHPCESRACEVTEAAHVEGRESALPIC